MNSRISIDLDADKSCINDSIKSTKLYLKKIGNLEELFFLLNVFPYIIYVKVKYMDHMDTKFIAKKTSTSRIGIRYRVTA
jgi:hypothetical protein